MLRMSPAQEGPGLRVFDTHPISVRRFSRLDDPQELKMNRFPLRPFIADTAAQKVRMAEDAWNTRDPARVAMAYTPDSRWRIFAYEWRDASGHWFRSENWEFDENRLMRFRIAS